MEGARLAHRSSGKGGETPSLRGEETSHKGWYVPRKLPHLDTPGVMQAITFRLMDSLPREVLAARKNESSAVQRRKLAAMLDAGHGACILRQPEVAEIVESALLHRHGSDYELHAWVIMPNHVHALIEQANARRLPDIIQAWKSSTAKAINRHRLTSGPVWQREYFDRYMRDGRHAEATIHYIEQNPLTAGLVAEAMDWRFGSAWWRAHGSKS